MKKRIYKIVYEQKSFSRNPEFAGNYHIYKQINILSLFKIWVHVDYDHSLENAEFTIESREFKPIKKFIKMIEK